MPTLQLLSRSRLLLLPLLLGGLSACGPDYSPDTYAGRAMQQANKVEQGTIVGIRPVQIAADGTTGIAAGAAAGGVVGTRIGGGDITSAFGGIGGGLLGGLLGSAAEQAAGTTNGFEYIVRKGNNELVSVAQKDQTPLALGQKVLVIAGNQARIVPDYTTAPEDPAAAAESRNHAVQPTHTPPAGGTVQGAGPLPAPQVENLPPPAGTPAPAAPTPSVTDPAPATPAPASPVVAPSSNPLEGTVAL
ncbi:outer membrane lipoprotein [Teichococcus aerophilus]|uniref:outer membrane lipoprotein n=1 Tax=Teichococcus aerophilus TaxID=1224513 RepID=UPI00346359EA